MLAKKTLWSKIKSRAADLCLDNKFPGSKLYWERRYARGGNSGAGSYDHLGQFKAQFINSFVEKYGIQSVIEFGCGDGHQLSQLTLPLYFGVDVSETALARCRSLYKNDPTKRFGLRPPQLEKFDLSLSLDVIYHLIEDDVFEQYMRELFEYSSRFVVIYSSDVDDLTFAELHGKSAPHVKHRHFTRWVQKKWRNWTLMEHKPSPYPFDPNRPSATSFCEFYVFQLN